MLKCYALKGVMGVNLYMIDFDDLKKEKKVIKRNLKKDFNMFYQKGKRLNWFKSQGQISDSSY